MRCAGSAAARLIRRQRYNAAPGRYQMLKVAGVFAAAALTMATAAQPKRVAASSSWVKLPAAGEAGAMAFVAIDNPTMYEIYVVSATTDAAGKEGLSGGGQSGGARPQPLEVLTRAPCRR